MKKFWVILALLAVALNFSSASLWAQEAKEVAFEDKAAAIDESTAATEEATPAVVEPAKVAAPAVPEEEKKEGMESAVLPETAPEEDKVS